MPHYHFRVHEDDRYYEDEAGRDLADGDAAREEAVETVTAIAKDAFVAGSAENPYRRRHRGWEAVFAHLRDQWP